MAAATRRKPQHDTAPTGAPATLAGLGLVAGAVALWFGYPGVIVMWLGITIGAWIAPPAQFTGKKDSAGFPTPATQGETKAMQRYRFWSDLKYRLVFPSDLFNPGWPIYVSWVFGIAAGTAAWCLPSAALLDIAQPWLRHIQAVLAAVLVAQVCAARRRNMVPGDVSPGVTFWFITFSSIRSLRPSTLSSVTLRGWMLALSGLAGVLAGAWVGTFVPVPAQPLDSPVMWPALGAIAGLTLAVGYPWQRACLDEWRRLVEAREEWAPRWQMLKHDPAPFLLERKLVGSAVVDTFAAPGQMGAMAYWPLSPKLSPTLGSGQQIAILSTPNLDGQGQPQPGTRHPLEFRIVAWPAGSTPDITDPGSDPDEVKLFFEAAMVWAADGEGYARPILHEATPIGLTSQSDEVQPVDSADQKEAGHADDTPPGGRQAWGTTWLLPDGPPWEYIRKALAGPLSAHLGCQVLVDHRNEFLYAGGLTDGSTVFDSTTGVDPQSLLNLQIEDEWNRRWSDALKRDANPPRPEHPTRSEAQLPTGQVVRRQAFVTRQGVDPTEFFGHESKVAATLGGAPFVAITGWPSKGRSGERHAQAFTVYWSDQAVPANPDRLPPSRGLGPSAQQWVLAGRVNEAFKSARLAKPELHDAQCLTRPSSRGHVWRLALRLYGGVTLADVRGASDRLRQALGSEWLRVAEAPDGCILVVGARPATAELVDPEADGRYVASLDWEQAFLDAKVVGVGGVTPTLTQVDRLPHNQQVQVLDFTLPSGLAFVDVKAKTKALETSSKNAFVEVRPHPSGKAGVFRMLASEVNPMPEEAGFDFDAADTGDHRIPFATNLFGEPTRYDNKLDPMLLVSGASGGGKSVTLQALIYGAAIRSWGLYVIDPSKGAVDFNFSEPYAHAIGRTVWEAKGIIAAIYEKVQQRKAINSKYNCGNYRDLPDDVRYNHQLVVLDEFTSLMIPEQVPKAMDDSAETMQAIEQVKALNAAKAYIGTYVGKIVREARSTGFTLVLATQALKAKTLDQIPNAGDLKDNMSRMILGRASFGQLQAALKAPTEAPDQPDVLPPGRGMYEGNGRNAEFIQCWFEPDQSAFAKHIADYRLPEADRLDLSRFVEPELEVDGSIIDGPPPSLVPAPVEELEERDLGVVELDLDGEIDWDALTAEADGDDLDLALDLDSVEDSNPTPEPVAQTSDTFTEPQPPPLPDGVVTVDEHAVWDDVDPSSWEPATSAYGWSEIDALLGFLSDFPEVRFVTWSNPKLDTLGPDGVSLLSVVDARLTERGVRLIHEVCAADVDDGPEPAPAEVDDEFGTPDAVPAHLRSGSDDF